MSKAPKKVFFNASVILAGLNSPKGGSAKVLSWYKRGKLVGVVSEIIVEEVVRNAPRVNFSAETVMLKIQEIFPKISPSPRESLVNEYKEVVLDLGDAHVLASAKQESVDFLVTLDKKHLLALKDKVKIFKIVSPGELISILK